LFLSQHFPGGRYFSEEVGCVCVLQMLFITQPKAMNIAWQNLNWVSDSKKKKYLKIHPNFFFVKFLPKP
jgi:hypothetical protein